MTSESTWNSDANHFVCSTPVDFWSCENTVWPPLFINSAPRPQRSRTWRQDRNTPSIIGSFPPKKLWQQFEYSFQSMKTESSLHTSSTKSAKKIYSCKLGDGCVQITDRFTCDLGILFVQNANVCSIRQLATQMVRECQMLEHCVLLSRLMLSKPGKQIKHFAEYTAYLKRHFCSLSCALLFSSTPCPQKVEKKRASNNNWRCKYYSLPLDISTYFTASTFSYGGRIQKLTPFNTGSNSSQRTKFTCGLLTMLSIAVVFMALNERMVSK